MMVPMLDLAIERAAAAGARRGNAIGMAHRGRLNVLAHVLGMSYADIIAKFEGMHAQSAGTGDVKYHLGAEGTYATATGEPRGHAGAEPEPPRVRARRCRGHDAGEADGPVDAAHGTGPSLVVPIIIHGDAAFSGQGVVPETLNLARLRGYRHGRHAAHHCEQPGRLHDQPQRGAVDGLRQRHREGLRHPGLPRQCGRPGACLAVVRLAMMYREKFHGDVVIDLIGYRRYGHNEGDEPAYTQPVLYRRIGEQPPCAGCGRTGRRGRRHQCRRRSRPSGRKRVRPAGHGAGSGSASARKRLHDEPAREAEGAGHVDTAVPRTGSSTSTGSCTLAGRFQGNPKLKRQLEQARPQCG
jgi:2-oxoglutarate dehydrogenase complex dehydrogenase (E1) component-like enzyme